MQKPENIRSVLIIRCGALGDTVYSTGILDALQSEYGQACQIDWLTTPANKDIFLFDKRVRHTFSLKHRKVPLFLSPSKIKLFFQTLFKPYDLIINLESGKVFSRLIQALFAKNKRGEPFNSVHSKSEPHYRHQLLQQLYQDLVSEQHLLSAYPKVVGAPLEQIKKAFELPVHYIVINPSNSHLSKNINYRAWPTQYWQRLIEELSEKNIPLVLIGAANELKFLDQLLNEKQKIINLAGKTSLPELIGVIEHADMIVTTDTGPSHIAGATNTPALVLFGPTNKYAGPMPTPYNKVIAIETKAACSPCYNTPAMFECKDNICMAEITVEEVLSAMHGTIEKFNH